MKRILNFGLSILDWRKAVFPGLSLLLITAGTLQAQQQFDGWCARVKIEIEQELTLERIGFEATLTVTNNDGEDAITDFFANLTFEDPENPGEDASDLFFVRSPQLESINSVDGDGVIQPTRTAVIRWFIIPKIDAGGTDPRGKVYRVGCDLGGKLGGVEIPEQNMLVIPDNITVRPEPQLEITYFMPRDVQANNPFTERVESPVPFTLGVLVKNVGYGTARDLQIDSQQPKIVENIQGLPLVAQLLGARVMDSPLDRTSLVVDLGDIEPGQTRKGAWDMITSLSGEFIEFNATYTHASELGGEETSVINSLDAHFILREVINDQPGRDDILDFLAVTDANSDLIPDALYESEGNVLPVNHQTQVEVLQDLDENLEFVVGLNSNFEGWGYVRLDDPAQGNFEIERVTRSDGRVVHERNAWTSFRYDPSTNRRLDYFHIFDLLEDGHYYEYTVEYAPSEEDTEPPETEILFAGEYSRVGGVVYVTRDTEIYFIAEDDSPVSMYYKIDDEDFRPAMPFSLDEPGNYTITYYSEDAFGNVEDENVQLVVLSEAPPGFDEFDDSDVLLVQSGDTLSVRPSEADLGFSIDPTPFAVEADVAIFQGVVAWPRVKGVPPSPTSREDVSLTVTGSQVDYYRYRLNGGDWSAEAPAAEPLELVELSGTVELEILARSQHGAYLPEEEALSVSWSVSGSGYAFVLDGMPAVPVTESAAEIHVSGSGLELYRWRPDNSFFRAEAPPEEPITIDPLASGERRLDFVGLWNGQWQETDSPSRLAFTVDPDYGSNLSALTLVRSFELGELESDDVAVVWDGLDEDGRAVASGWYTARVTLNDSLGRSRHQTRLVHVGDMAADATLLAGATDGAARPHARGDWAVWQDRTEGAWNIRARNLADSAATTLAITSGSRDRTHPVTDGRYVVWQARRSGGAWDVWMRELGGPDEASPLTDSSSLHATRPLVDAPWVVWRERPVGDSDAPWQLVAYNLDTGDRFIVDAGPADQGEADLQSGRLVWRDQRDVGPGEIYFADLETGERRRLTESIHGQYHPAVAGHWVVWQDTREGVLDIYGYDFLQGAEVRVTDSPENEALPYLQGYWMVTEEDGAGLGTGNFRLFHLEAGRSVPLTRSAREKAHPGFAAGRFVWEETGDEGTVIRAARLPALQAVFADNNAVVVTSGLADRFESAFALLENWHENAGVLAVGRYQSLVPEVVRETAEWNGGAASGDDFAIESGDFLWVRFSENRLIELGERQDEPIDLQAGVNAVSYNGFPGGFRASRLIEQLGSDKVQAVRMLDSLNGRWVAVTVEGDALVGPDFAIPESALLLVEMNEAVGAWKPE